MLDQIPGHDTVVGGYRLEGVLGRGGMGVVYRARHMESGRVVALKLMAGRNGADLGGRFRAEGRAQAALEHPNVVMVYDAGESEQGLYLAMRLVDGPPLAELIREREAGARRTVDLLGQVADALDAAHAAGLVHRDVKPQNVLVGEGDHAYLADFGLTRFGGETAMTDSGALLGTVAYLAPEVVRGGDATAASDRYAFAAMAFECLTGTPVFPRTSNAAVLFAHANDPPPRIGGRRPELGDALDDLFERALCKDPAERPASARELVDGIRRALERAGATELPPPPLTGAAALAPATTTDPVTPLPGPAVTAPPARRGGRRSRRRALVIAALAALAGAAIVALAWLLFDGDDAQPAPAVAPDRAGLDYVGATLDGPAARPLDCRGRPPGPASPPCTIAQTALPGATIVVPEKGVIREWTVRGARGELTLVVLRPRDGGAFQVEQSATETVGSADVHRFAADVAVDPGDLVGLRLTPGSAVGTRDAAAGASIDRWLPPVYGAGRPADRGAGTGFDHELLLRVGILPDGTRRQTAVNGAAAARLPAGRRLAVRSARLQGRPIRLALIDLGGRFAVDEFAGGRRVARVHLPGMRPRAEVVRFVVAEWSPEQVGLDVNFVNEDSARIVQLGYVVTGPGIERLR